MTGQLRHALAILRCKQVEREVGLSRSTIYERIRSGTFPAQIRIGPRAVGWRTGDIDLWLADPFVYRSETIRREPEREGTETKLTSCPAKNKPDDTT
jgi:prophage regulatory protein